MKDCIECGGKVDKNAAKICDHCRATITRPCKCGCGMIINKYKPDHGLRPAAYAKGHSNKKYFSDSERRQANTDQRRANLHKWWAWAINHMGGKCTHCGLEYDGKNACVFQFHHVNPEEKSFQIRPREYGDAKIRAELKKCIMLCANCHFIEHSEEY